MRQWRVAVCARQEMLFRPGQGLSENGPSTHDPFVGLPPVLCEPQGQASPSGERTACFAQGRVNDHVGLESIPYGGSLVVTRYSGNSTS